MSFTHFGLATIITIPSGRMIYRPACRMHRFTFKTTSSRDPREVTCPKCKKTSDYLDEKKEWDNV